MTFVERLKASLKPWLRSSGASATLPRDFEDLHRRIWTQVAPYTMTSAPRVYAAIEATRYIVRNRIPGAFVECGVWRGGSSMAMALALIDAGETERDLYLYDTFAGMSAPTEVDVRADGRASQGDFERQVIDPATNAWCLSPLEEVTANLATTGYPQAWQHFVKGKVEESIPGTLPEAIALLRLDTDWYESTRHELEYLYPLLSPGGVLILDDYGHWQGARKAVDEYFARLDRPPLLHRIDATGRLAVVPG